LVINNFYKAATVLSPLAETSVAVVVDIDSFLDANEHFSFLSSKLICCCLHSRLQKALSPLQEAKLTSLKTKSMPCDHY
jgi:hypothetical protein